MKPRRIQRKVGDVLAIELGHRQWGFGRALDEALYAFYDLRSSKLLSPEAVVSARVAFRLFVMRYAVTRGDWPVIGNLPLDSGLQLRPWFFMQDLHSGEVTKTLDGREQFPATWAEASQLERAAVWEPRHVVERLDDHFAGRPSAIVERLSLKGQVPLDDRS